MDFSTSGTKMPSWNILSSTSAPRIEVGGRHKCQRQSRRRNGRQRAVLCLHVTYGIAAGFCALIWGWLGISSGGIYFRFWVFFGCILDFGSQSANRKPRIVLALLGDKYGVVLKWGKPKLILLCSKHPKARSLKLTCIHTKNYAWHCPKPVYYYQSIVVQLMLFFKKLSAHHGTETQLSHVMNLKNVLMLGAIMPASNRTVQPAECGDMYACTAFASSAPGLLN